MGRRKSQEVREADEAGAGGERVNKREVVRQALQALGGDAKPMQIRDWVHEKYGSELSLNLISNYKSNLSKTASGQSGVHRVGRAGRPPKSAAGDGRSVGGVSVSDLETLKRLNDRLGPDQLRSLIGLFGK